MATAAEWKAMLIALLGVFVAIASLLLIAWMFTKGHERTQQSPRLRKVFFAAVAALYAIWMAVGVVKVIQGKESSEVLLGLPGGILLVWLFTRGANRSQTLSSEVTRELR